MNNNKTQHTILSFINVLKNPINRFSSNYTLNECFLINFFSVKNEKKHKEENVVVNDDHEGKFIYFCLF